VAVAAAVSGCRELRPRASAGQPQRLPTTTIHVGPHRLVVEVADEESERQLGMSFRRQLGPDEAMLFVFPRDGILAFWSRDCYVDLDLAFVRPARPGKEADSEGVIVQVARMPAHSRDRILSAEPVRLALETPAGWLEAHDVGVGTKVQFSASLTLPNGPPGRAGATSLQPAGRPVK